MIGPVLNSKNFLAVVLAMATGTLLYLKIPWPLTDSLHPSTWNEYYLGSIAVHDPWSEAALKAGYRVMLFATPYMGYSFLLSAPYIFSLRPRKKGTPQALPPFPLVERSRSANL